MGFGPPKNVQIVELSNYGSYSIMSVYREGYIYIVSIELTFNNGNLNWFVVLDLALDLIK